MKIKLLFTFAFFILSLGTILSQPLFWSGEITVANGSTYGKTRPRIAITSGNIPVIMWGGGTAAEPLYTARWNGTGFDTPVTITPVNMDPFIDSWAGAEIAASGNTVFVVFKAEPMMTTNIYVVKSTDGGVTWGLPIQADMGVGPLDDFPSIAVSDAGNPSVMFMVFDSVMADPHYVVTSSVDGGATYPPAITVSDSASDEVCDCCPGYLAIKGNYFVPAWRRNSSNIRDMWIGISSDAGMTYPDVMDMDNTNWMITSCPSSGPSPFLTTDSVITAFMSRASGSYRIYLSTASYTGLQNGFTAFADNTVTSTTIQNYPFLAGSNDTVALVYQQTVSGNSDAMYSYSYTGASGLSGNSYVLNNSAAGNQKNPHVAYSSGTFHFVWVDFATGNVMYKAGTIPTGISENENRGPLAVYPNPSDGAMRIDLPMLNGKKGMLEIFDVNGKAVQSADITGMKSYMIEKQIPGIYSVKISGEDGFQQHAKVIFY
ncbi:MAG: T9SS type A sorting domain-containing protein [Bacteroidota bacterium]|nr:T9SS type A sorting domain-containing protein [Bacteroidota bacterium]